MTVFLQNRCDDYFKLLILMVQLFVNDTVFDNINAFDPKLATKLDLILKAMQFCSSTVLNMNSTLTKAQSLIIKKVS